MYREYKLNGTFGIVCSSNGASMRVEVVMICVPWLEVVEGYNTLENVDEANRVFKQMVEKYKGKVGTLL